MPTVSIQGEFAPDQVAQMTEEDRAEWAQDETEPEYREARQQHQIVVAWWKEMLGEKNRQHTIDVKVVPFGQRADR
jgi:hypothetical protein